MNKITMEQVKAALEVVEAVISSDYLYANSSIEELRDAVKLWNEDSQRLEYFNTSLKLNHLGNMCAYGNLPENERTAVKDEMDKLFKEIEGKDF